MRSNLFLHSKARRHHARHLLASSAAVIGLLGGSGALADPLDVTTATATPVTTAAANNGSAGDVTVESGDSIIVSGAGPAVTVNSSNTVTNIGTIGSSAATGATALLIDGTAPITTTITNTGTLSITGTGGSGNYGLRLMNGPVSGTIMAGTASVISVLGANATGVSIESPFTGNVTLNSVSVTGDNSTAIDFTAPVTGNVRLTGANSATGSGGIGVSVADISGSLVNAGTINMGASSHTITASDGTTTTGGAVGGIAGIRIGGSIGGGFLNDRYYVDSTGAVIADAAAISTDTLITGTITGYAGTRAVLIAPSAANPSSITLSPYGSAVTDDGYGFVNRGTIASTSTVSTLGATAVSVTGTTVGGTLYSATLANGLVNQAHGVISATSSSGGSATAIDFGAGAIAPAVLNEGSVLAAQNATPTGDNAYGIHIEAGAQVGGVVNSGTISATTDKGTASYGILDEAGTLTSVTNSGTISAIAPTAGSTIRAIDLSAGAVAQTVTNSGTITGEILFGSGGGTYISHSGSFIGSLAYGGGDNQLTLAGTTNFLSPVTVASGGALAVSITDTATLQFAGTAPVLSSLSASGQSTLVLDASASSPALQIGGAAAFTDQSKIKLIITQPGSGTLTVLTAAGGIATDHAATLISGASTPYLYTLGSATVGANSIQVALHQRTAAEAGFSPSVASLYDQSLLALSGGGAAFQAIANLPDQASVLAAYRQIEPPSYGTALTRIAESVQTAGFGMVADRMNGIAGSIAAEAGSGSRLGLWAQESGQFLRHSDSQDDPGFSSNGVLLGIGADYRLAGHLVVGVAANFAWEDVKLTGQATDEGKPLTANSQIGDIYAHWSKGPFYVQAIGSFGNDNYKFTRTISIGGYTATQSAKWTGTQMAADLIAGARLHYGRLLIEPSDAFTYMRLRQDKYAETGTGALDLTINSQHVKLATNTAKLAATYELPLWGGALSFGARGGYVVRLDRTIPGLDGSFTTGGEAFTLQSAPLGRTERQEGATIGYHMDNFLISFSGDRRQEAGFSATGVAATLRVSF
jgi:hypothetical protein